MIPLGIAHSEYGPGADVPWPAPASRWEPLAVHRLPLGGCRPWTRAFEIPIPTLSLIGPIPVETRALTEAQRTLDDLAGHLVGRVVLTP